MLGILALFFSYGTNAFAYSVTSIPSASDPRNMVVLGSKIYITNFFSDSVSVLDTTTDTLTTPFSISNAFAITALGSKVYVGQDSDSAVSIIDTANGNAITQVAVGGTPAEFAASSDKVYTANGSAKTVSIIDSTSNAVTTVELGHTAEHIAIIGTKVYVTSGADNLVTVIDTAGGNSTSSIAVGSNPYSITALGNKLYVSNRGNDTTSIIDTAGGNSITTVSVGHFISTSLALLGNVYVLNVTNVGFGSNSVSIINGTADTAATVQITGSDNSNSAATVATIGTKLFIAYRDGGSVEIFDTSDNTFSRLTVGTTPFSIVAVGSKVYVASRGSNTIAIITPTYALNYTAGEHGTLGGSVSQTIAEAANGSTVTAVPDTGYRFASWSDGSTQNPRTDTNVQGAITVSATFQLQSGNGPIVGLFGTVGIFTGIGSGYIAPRMQTIYPDGRVVYLDALPPQPAATSKTLIITKQLSLGDESPQILSLQKYLNTHGYILANYGPGSVGLETSRYGLATKNAVLRFQKANGISQTGTVGPLTRAALGK